MEVTQELWDYPMDLRASAIIYNDARALRPDDRHEIKLDDAASAQRLNGPG